MKKMILLCIVPCVILALVFVSSMLLPTQLSYPFKVTKGDIKTIEDIGYHVSFNTNSYSTIGVSSARIDLWNKNGRTTNTKTYHEYYEDLYMDQKPLHSSESSTHYVGESLPTNYDGTTCEENVKEVSTLPLRYNFTLNTKETTQVSVEDEKGKQLILDTGLQYVSNEKQKLYTTETTCDETSEPWTGSYVQDLDDNYSSVEGGIIQGEKNEFYFMAATQEGIVGQNKIYRIMIKEQKNATGYKVYQGETKDIVALPENRYYDYLMMIDDKLIVFAHGEDGYYLMRYELDGTFLDEILISKEIDNGMLNVYSDGSYAFPIINDAIYVIDTKAKNVVENYALPKDERVFIQDIIYQNDTLYLLTSKDIWDASEKNTGIANVKEQRIVVQAVKEHKLIFEAVQTLSKQQSNNNPIYLYLQDAAFEREDDV